MIKCTDICIDGKECIGLALGMPSQTAVFVYERSSAGKTAHAQLLHIHKVFFLLAQVLWFLRFFGILCSISFYGTRTCRDLAHIADWCFAVGNTVNDCGLALSASQDINAYNLRVTFQ